LVHCLLRSSLKSFSFWISDQQHLNNVFSDSDVNLNTNLNLNKIEPHNMTMPIMGNTKNCESKHQTPKEFYPTDNHVFTKLVGKCGLQYDMPILWYMVFYFTFFHIVAVYALIFELDSPVSHWKTILWGKYSSIRSFLEHVFKKRALLKSFLCPSVPFVFSISAPRELKIWIKGKDYVSPRNTEFLIRSLEVLGLNL
jgi:hypothetical protein